MERGIKIVNGTVSTEPAGELADNSCQNSLPGDCQGHFIMVQKSFERRQYLLCAWMLLQHKKRQGSLFSQVS